MSRLIYLTHPQVVIDPAVPVPDWGLTAQGAGRVARAIERGAFAGIRRVVSSAERKAWETAGPIAAALRLGYEIRPAMHENDRSATGFLPGPDFEATADAFFAQPEDSIRGWERAIDAQARIVSEVAATLEAAAGRDVLCIGHGGVGTLLLCHYDGRAIARSHDQGKGGGNAWAFDLSAGRLLHGWVPLEDLRPVMP